MYQKGIGKKIKIRFNHHSNEMNKPRNYIIKNLISKSESEVFEEAREEWVIETIIDSTCDGFSGVCQLCQTHGLKYNFVLTNPKTNFTMLVGSTCILRFHVGKGVVSVESGITLLQNMADEQYLINHLQTHIKDMLPLRVDRKALKDYVTNLKKVMELRGISNPTDEQLCQLCFGVNWDPGNVYNIKRVRMLWDKPGMIETKVSNKLRKDAAPKEGKTWGYKKRTRVATTLVSSEIYDVERYIVESNSK